MYSVRLFLSAESSDHNSEVHCVQDMWGIPVLHLQPGPHTAEYLLMEKMEFEIEPVWWFLAKKVLSIPLVYGFWAISRRAVRLTTAPNSGHHTRGVRVSGKYCHCQALRAPSVLAIQQNFFWTFRRWYTGLEEL